MFECGKNVSPLQRHYHSVASSSQRRTLVGRPKYPETTHCSATWMCTNYLWRSSGEKNIPLPRFFAVGNPTDGIKTVKTEPSFSLNRGFIWKQCNLQLPQCGRRRRKTYPAISRNPYKKCPSNRQFVYRTYNHLGGCSSPTLTAHKSRWMHGDLNSVRISLYRHIIFYYRRCGNWIYDLWRIAVQLHAETETKLYRIDNQ